MHCPRAEFVAEFVAELGTSQRPHPAAWGALSRQSIHNVRHVTQINIKPLHFTTIHCLIPYHFSASFLFNRQSCLGLRPTLSRFPFVLCRSRVIAWTAFCRSSESKLSLNRTADGASAVSLFLGGGLRADARRSERITEAGAGHGREVRRREGRGRRNESEYSRNRSLIHVIKTHSILRPLNLIASECVVRHSRDLNVKVKMSIF